MNPKERFLASMAMDYEKWHDGIGYDLDALDDMTDEERASVEQTLLAKVNDWRDLEALDRIGTPAAHAAISKVQASGAPELRIAAQNYGPEPPPEIREAAILAGLQERDVFGGLSKALDQAAEHPTPKVTAALLKCARDLGGVAGYHAAAVLYFLGGKIESHEGMEKREFFLRFVDEGTEDHQAAFIELCRELGHDPTRTD